jgi:hypothetical protein
MNEVPTRTTAFVIIAYIVSAIPLVVWILWSLVLRNELDATYRTTFGILLLLPILSLAYGLYGLFRKPKAVKIALVPLVLFALLVALLCYIVSISTVGQ